MPFLPPATGVLETEIFTPPMGLGTAERSPMNVDNQPSLLRLRNAGTVSGHDSPLAVPFHIDPRESTLAADVLAFILTFLRHHAGDDGCVSIDAHVDVVEALG